MADQLNVEVEEVEGARKVLISFTPIEEVTAVFIEEGDDSEY